MDEQKSNIRPTKKQRELLLFIDGFIQEHGYSPSYREIMAGCDYTSVATVSLHVNNLIRRGHLLKRDHSARSLEVVRPSSEKPVTSNQIAAGQEKWLVEQVAHRVHEAEQLSEVAPSIMSDIDVLVAALRVLELDEAAQSFGERIAAIRERVIAN